MNWTSWFNRATAVQTVEALDDRSREAPRGPRAVLRGLTLRSMGRPAAASLVTRKDLYGRPARESRLGGFNSVQELLQDSSFYLPLQPNEGGAAAQEGNLVLWGQGSTLQVEDKQGNTTFDGDTVAVRMGVDGEWGDLLAGISIGKTTGDAAFDQKPCTKEDKGKCRGRMDADLTSVHAYLRASPQPHLSVWGALGYGTGEAKKTFSDDFTMKADLNQVMAAIGAYGGIIPAETAYGFEIGLQTDALFAKMSADYPGEIHDEDATATRIRVAVVAERNHQFDWGGVIAGSLEAAVRHDGGDGAKGAGVELAGRVRHFNPILGLTASASLGGLVMHSDDDFHELGMSASLRWDPGRYGRGGAVSLQPAWGAPVSGSRLSRRSDLPALGEREPSDPRGRLDGEFSYGFDAFRGKGVHTPYLGVSLAEDAADTARVGWRVELDDKLNIGMEASRRFPRGRDPKDDRVTLQATLRW